MRDNASRYLLLGEQNFQAEWIQEQQPEQEGTWSGIGQLLPQAQSQFLSYYINHSHIPCLPRNKWNFLDQRTVAKIRLWNGNKSFKTCEQRKPGSTKQHSQTRERTYFPKDIYCPILVHYCLATQFGTEVLPAVVARKEQDATPDAPQQCGHFKMLSAIPSPTQNCCPSPLLAKTEHTKRINLKNCPG